MQKLTENVYAATGNIAGDAHLQQGRDMNITSLYRLYK